MKRGFLALICVMGIALTLSACARAPSNVQTLVSDNCGNDWRLVPVGDTVPVGGTNYCFMKVTVPNYPMVGESNFRGVFANRVRVNINSSYDYTITNALQFIREARFVTQQGAAGDSPQNGATVWDAAEGIIIDRLLRDIANSADFLLAEDIVEFNQGEFEDRIMLALNEALAERGVQLNTFTFVVTPDDQTRNMIDVAAALRVCAMIDGMTPEACQNIIVARAGAPRVTVSTANVDTN